MAYDTGLADLLRESLGDLPFTEKAMFGGISFLLNGHMVCGVTKQGAIFRVGAPNDAAALAMAGVSPMMFTGKPMSGFTSATDEAVCDDPRRDALVHMAVAFVKTLPAKKPQAPKPVKES